MNLSNSNFPHPNGAFPSSRRTRIAKLRNMLDWSRRPIIPACPKLCPSPTPMLEILLNQLVPEDLNMFLHPLPEIGSPLHQAALEVGKPPFTKVLRLRLDRYRPMAVKP
jgi:hypothetical protein